MCEALIKKGFSRESAQQHAFWHHETLNKWRNKHVKFRGVVKTTFDANSGFDGPKFECHLNME